MKKEVLEIVDDAQLNDRERVWIETLDTYENGYNLTKGGDENPMLYDSSRNQLKRTLATSESSAKRSKIIKGYHSDPEKHAEWLVAHTAAHSTPESRAKKSSNNKKAWAKPGARKQRGNAIRDALNTPEMVATRADRAARSKATKKAKREGKLPVTKEDVELRRKKREQAAKRSAAKKAKANLSSGTTTSAICESDDTEEYDCAIWWKRGQGS